MRTNFRTVLTTASLLSPTRSPFIQLVNRGKQRQVPTDNNTATWPGTDGQYCNMARYRQTTIPQQGQVQTTIPQQGHVTSNNNNVTGPGTDRQQYRNRDRYRQTTIPQHGQVPTNNNATGPGTDRQQYRNRARYRQTTTQQGQVPTDNNTPTAPILQ